MMSLNEAGARRGKCGARENERVDSRLARTAVARTFSMTPVRVFALALDVTEDRDRHLIGQPLSKFKVIGKLGKCKSHIDLGLTGKANTG